MSGDAESAEIAFEILVERYGPMVLQICRSMLRDLHAADDAFQATFFVLARKAHTLQSRSLLANWLYGVALRAARKARVIAARQCRQDQHAAILRAATIVNQEPEEQSREWEIVLH